MRTNSVNSQVSSKLDQVSTVHSAICGLAMAIHVEHCPTSRAIGVFSIAKSFGRRRGRATRGRSLRLPNATYVEGVFVVSGGLQFDHAWLERGAGVVDLTPSYIAMPDGDCTYFAGPRWTLSDVLALFTPDNADLPTPLPQPGTPPSPRREA